MKKLISRTKQQFKANLHCHSTLSDGKRTPQELVEMYRKRGYSILAITDHECPKNHSAMSTPDFLMLTAYEGHIRPDPSGKYNAFAPEVHLNLFAKNPENETSICYNKSYARFLKDPENIKRAGSERVREYSVDYVNEYIRTAIENGYLVSYNHPVWSMEREQDILAYEGIFSLEIYNNGSYSSNHIEHNGVLYDKMLCMGKQVFCHATDDNHNKYPTDSLRSDSFGGFTMISADSLSYENIIASLEAGDFYASTGPLIYELTLDGRYAHIECSPAKLIIAYVGSKAPVRIYAEEGEALQSAGFEIHEKAKYVRFAVIDKDEKIAYTRGFCFE